MPLKHDLALDEINWRHVIVLRFTRSYFCANYLLSLINIKPSTREQGNPEIREHLYSALIHEVINDWFKLFGNHKESSHWKRIFDDDSDCIAFLLKESNQSESEFLDLWKRICECRNKFTAHLDLGPNELKFPTSGDLNKAWLMVRAFHEYLFRQPLVLAIPNLFTKPLDTYGHEAVVQLAALGS